MTVVVVPREERQVLVTASSHLCEVEFLRIMSESRCSDLATIHYLPRFARRAKQAKVRQIGYSVDKDPVTARITFNYNIAWTDIDDSLVRRYELLKTNMTKKTTKGGRDDREFLENLRQPQYCRKVEANVYLMSILRD
ncbi:hypothetical protein Y032_0267g734 [Ancylostoma ceylanicum]|uniref:Uncharacterized protein n=1 Tax=Ancylostoma ceylanicum TaxID=53326 RepID=A0A016S945_9BILA|nr:hypothetical protein Y032_0267g734 [Ancylostoma ceylanicum]